CTFTTHAHVDDCSKRSPWLVQVVDVNFDDHLYLSTVTKFFDKCEDCLFKRQFIELLIRNSRAYLKHFSEVMTVFDYLKLKSFGVLWEDFIYHVEKSNEMYYPCFTKIIVSFFMTKDQSIPRRNNVNWHFARDDHMFIAIKFVSRNQNSQQYGAILPIELTNEAIGNLESYKELKTSAKVDKPAKVKQLAKAPKAKGADEGTGIILGVPDVPTYESDDEKIS
nr:hypothetical protein [Tanacetum cinerariifolium]